MNNIRPFELVIVAISAISALIGLFFLANYTPDASEDEKLYGDRVEIWGTLDAGAMQVFLQKQKERTPALDVVSYVEVDPRQFNSELVNAIAEGRSPDLIILPHDLLVTYRSKLTPISFESMSERSYRDTYIDGAEIFMRNDGIYGIPFAVDPLVMYWNRDLYASGGVALPPKSWESLMNETIPALVRKNTDQSLAQSAIAFGEFVNVLHAKEILAMLLLQAGSDIVRERDNGYEVTFGNKEDDGFVAGDTVVTFYTQFINPTRELYTWNRSKEMDRKEFLGGTLATYFGKGSERVQLDRENANLNYDVAPVPQESTATIHRVYGDFYAFAVPRASQNAQGAYAVASLFASDVPASELVATLGFAPVRRTLLSVRPADPFMSVVYDAALIARGWLDPSPLESAVIFRSTIEEVSSGRARLRNAITDMAYQLEQLFR
jgi:ABC-type glycerol-3-phosphate transport system substrate-binding protein